MYEIEYLPKARQDLIEIVTYMIKGSCNPEAALKLSVSITEGAEGLSTFPYALPVYIPTSPLAHEYRRLRVKDHFIFYWIEEVPQKVVISRIVYSRRNTERSKRRR